MRATIAAKKSSARFFKITSFKDAWRSFGPLEIFF